MTDAPNNNTLKLPIKRILALSVQLIKQRIQTFLRLGLPLFVLIILGSLVILIDESIINFFLKSNFPTFIIFLVFILVWVIAVMVTVGCHRGFLLKESDIHQTKVIRWQSREWKFFGWGILVGIIVAVLSFIYGLLIQVFGFDISDNSMQSSITFQVLFLPIMYVFSRWSLVFPSTAIEDPETSLIDAWVLSDGNGWRLTFLISVVPFIFDLLFSIIPFYNSLLLSIITVVVWLLIAVFQIGLLSLSYAFLKGNFNKEDEVII